MNQLIGTVITNAAGEKAISFTDEAWAALPVGSLIYAGQFEAVGYRARFFKEPHKWMIGRWGSMPVDDNPHAESEVLYVWRAPQ
jgi:hypothetical protein